MSVIETPVISFKGNNYKVQEVTIGSLLDIEVMKATLSNGSYGDLVSHRTLISNWTLDNIDVFSTLMVLCPTLVEKDLTAKTWRDLTPEDANELKLEYSKSILPWFNQRISFLNPAKKEEESSK